MITICHVDAEELCPYSREDEHTNKEIAKILRSMRGNDYNFLGICRPIEE